MRVIIAGSRSVTNYRTLLAALVECPFTSKITEVVSGAAQGVDRLGERWAGEQGIPIGRFPANWERDGRAAGYKRNLEMAEYADALVAVWDGESRGTEHMAEAMLKERGREGGGKRVWLWRTDKGTGAEIESLLELSESRLWEDERVAFVQGLARGR